MEKFYEYFKTIQNLLTLEEDVLGECVFCNKPIWLSHVMEDAWFAGIPALATVEIWRSSYVRFACCECFPYVTKTRAIVRLRLR